MDFLIDFYKELDTLNLIIFWGVIIVVILLLIFSITIANKNKKLKMIINSKEKEKNNQELLFPDEIAIATKEKEKEENTKTTLPDPYVETNSSKEEIKEEKTEETEKFIAEEHVMEYNNDLFKVSTIKKTQEQKEEKKEHISKPSEINFPKEPYQRNVLREMSLNQTSPIGIVNREKQSEKIINKAKELENALKEPEDNIEKKEEIIKHEIKEIHSKEKTIEPITKINSEPQKIPQTNNQNHNISKNKKTVSELKTKNENTTPLSQTTYDYFKTTKEPVEEYKVESYLEQIDIDLPKSKTDSSEKKDSYLEEVSKKLAESDKIDDIDRTEYELKQEEEAIISYEELMKKKDTIKIIDEEEAIISIEELLRKKGQEDKLYNLTEEEENDKFINELKSFRNDL